MNSLYNLYNSYLFHIMSTEYKTALFTAFKQGFPDDVIKYIYQQLCANGNGQFDINEVWSQFWDYSAVKSVKGVEALLKFGANINHQMADTGSTPIMYLAQKGWDDVVRTRSRSNH